MEKFGSGIRDKLPRTDPQHDKKATNFWISFRVRRPPPLAPRTMMIPRLPAPRRPAAPPAPAAWAAGAPSNAAANQAANLPKLSGRRIPSCTASGEIVALLTTFPVQKRYRAYLNSVLDSGAAPDPRSGAYLTPVSRIRGR
jgi:hypothetical protein